MDRSIEPSHCTQKPPVVVIYNNLETFYPFLSRFEDPSILEKRKYRGDRALFWLGSQKLVIASSSIPDAERLCQLYGYKGTRSITPRKPSYQLSLDILNDPQTVAHIVQLAGPGKAIRLIPYAATREMYRLARFLRETCGLRVDLPESPAEKDIEIRDFYDTKLGFRRDAPDWITESVRLPRGFGVQDRHSASEAITWFLIRGLDCMVKPDRGESGLGIQYFDHHVAHPNLLAELQSNAFCPGESVLVEEYIRPQAGLSPSLELFVPPLGCGEPFITYLSNQHFGQLGRFSGVIISKSYLEANWYAPLAENGLRIASQLQKLGYVGNFDLDTVIDQQGRVYLLEINTRRTGGTHAHEFGRFAFTDRYLEDVALFSSNQVKAAGVSSLDQLFELLSPVLFPICSEKRGVVITVSSTLKSGDFGCLIVGESIADLMEIKQEMEFLLHPVVQVQ
ncbi:D-alanine-D-alanine ligase [Longilinea arvoryzae]|uniref:D-alanine-D-alanine ligase n=1 Tax=Longilinea arvoryzae TaxID=360412 RepID=A0A0S7BJ45_9CHLR|nr:hypothetical protein [Longilinea arvoryzae]GAP13674.1 D-alanine-D-alanine ligase [Longilinea arvoryzae]